MSRSRFAAGIAAALLALAAPLLTACSSGTAESDASNADPALPLTLIEGWAKSAEADGMTGVFGTLENTGDVDIELLSVSSDAAGLIEFHEVTEDAVMQEIAGPVIVPAGGVFELAPGADHIMLMELRQDLLAGDEVTFTLTYDVQGQTLEQTFTVLVKDFSGANEDYGDLQHDHSAHDHDAHDHGSDGDHDDNSHGDHSSETDDHGSH